MRTLSETLDRQGRLEEQVRELERLVEQVAASGLLAQERSISPAREADVRAALRQVIDPEVGISVVDMGLIKEIALNGRGVQVRMVLTSPTCPLAGYLVEQVRRKVRSVTGGEPVEVVLVDAAWSWNDTAPRLLWGDGI